MRFPLVLAAAIIAVAGATQGKAARAEDTLTLYFHERAPYSVLGADGKAHGVVADIAGRALDSAGIAYRWEDLPSARQLEVIKRGEELACGLGWFKRPEREAFAKFSAPLYRDLPPIVVARAGDARFADTPRLADLFAARDLTLLLKTGYSYGAEIDAMIQRLAPQVLRDASENRIMLGMVGRGRADYMIMAEEEAADLLQAPDMAAAGLALFHLKDPPPGEYRYLMCSKAVPDDLIARIDRALPQVQ